MGTQIKRVSQGARDPQLARQSYGRVEVELEGRVKSKAAVPPGASTSVHETLELRDGDK